METSCLFLAVQVLEEEDGKVLWIEGIKGTTGMKLKFSRTLKH